MQENAQVVNLVQALVGAITQHMRRVSIEVFPDGAGARIWFLLSEDTEEDREEISEVVFSFDAMQQPHTKLEVEVLVDDRPIEEIELPGRAVFGRKEE